MPKRLLQKNSQKPSLKEFLDTYPAVTLQAGLNGLENSQGWELFKAYAEYVQRRYEIDALDMIAKHDMVQAAAYASGYAKAVSDLTESFVPGLRSVVLGKDGVVETQRPEE